MGRFVVPALLASLVLAVLARESAAQSFSFAIGGGHHHGWHHHHCWDDPWFWGPQFDYVYVAPPPPRVVYVQPREVEVRTLVPQDSTARPAANSVPRTSTGRLAASTIPDSDGTPTVQIWNGGGQKIPVAFLVDSQQVELYDGQSHSLHGSGKRIVEFDRGGSFGTARYELSGGQYEFVVTSRGWDLVRRANATSGMSLKPLVKKNVLPNDTVTR
jgi:hypothetical protein